MEFYQINFLSSIEGIFPEKQTRIGEMKVPGPGRKFTDWEIGQ